MSDRIMRIAVFILAVAFAVSPFLSSGFGGFYPESFPVQVSRWPAQPAGWAFSIWGLIYLGLILASGRAFLQPGRTPEWGRVAQPLGISLLIGAFWIEAAKLVLPAPEGSIEFAAMIVAPTGEALRPSEAVGPEIMVGAVTIRLEAGASAERISAIVRALSAPA